MTIERENNTEISTGDMALVTVLKMRGIEPTRLERKGGGCRWYFAPSNGTQDIVDEYTTDEAYVEPREFSRKMGLVRAEMYQFLGMDPRAKRQG